MATNNGFKHVNESKSLCEQINEIKKSRMSKADKVISLKACGLRDKEISVILSTSVPKGLAKKRYVWTFGVEIECIHAERTALVEAGRINKVDIRSETYNHDKTRYFKIVSDSSVHGTDANEVVSPVLNGSNNGLLTLKRATKALDAVGATVNSTCGLHVHIGAETLTDEQYVNVFKNYQKLERLIDTLMAPSRRGECRWAKSLRPYDFSDCHNHKDVCRTLGYDRYYKVNSMSYNRHKTIEFRQHQGSTNYEKISNWVKFCGKLVTWSCENVLTEEVASVDAIPFLDEEEKAFFGGRVIDFSQSDRRETNGRV